MAAVTAGAALAITSIAASGDFAETNTRGASLAAAANCAIAVTFTPTVTGSRTGTLTVTDNASGSPQTEALTGAGADLTITPGSGSSTSSTVTAGQPATYTLALAPVSGLTGTFGLTCTGFPTGAACTPSPASITLSGTAAATVTVTVTTTARSLIAPSADGDPLIPAPLALAAWGRAWGWAAGALLLLLLGFVIAERRSRRWWTAAVVVSLFGLMTACGGLNNLQQTPPATGTPAGVYTLTVTSTGSGGVTRSTKLTRNVK